MYKLSVSISDTITVETDLPSFRNNDVTLYCFSEDNHDPADFHHSFLTGELQNKILDYDFGRFLFIFVSEISKKVTIVSDYLGTQHIYIKKESGCILLSNEIHRVADGNTEIDINSIYEHLSFMTVVPPDTIFKNVSTIPGGTIMEISKSSESKIRYLHLEEIIKNKNTDYDDLVKRGRILVENYLKTKSDETIAVALSGGIDSGGLISVLNRLQPPTGKISTFSVGAYGASSSDLVSARKTAKYCNAHNYEIYPQLSDLHRLWNYEVGNIRPVWGDSVLMHSMIAEKAAKQQCSGILYGSGAEMLLGNLQITRAAYKLRFEKLIPTVPIKFLYKLLAPLIAKSKNQKKFLLAVKDNVERLLHVRGAHFEPFSKYFTSTPEAAWDRAKNKAHKFYDPSLQFDDQILKMQLGTWINYFQNRDFSVIYNGSGVQLYTPYLTYDFMRFFASVPLKFRMKNKWNKQVLRDIYEPYVPDHLKNSPVRSLVIPYNEWFVGREQVVLDYLAGSKIFGNAIDFNKLREDIETLPIRGLFLMKLLGLAVWFDANFAPERKVAFDKIFK